MAETEAGNTRHQVCTAGKDPDRVIRGGKGACYTGLAQQRLAVLFTGICAKHNF